MEIFGYLDPGTGSLILQVAVGAIVGIGVAAKAYWSRIVGLFAKKKSSEESENKSKSSQ